MLTADITWTEFKTIIVYKERVRFADRTDFYIMTYEDQGGVFRTSVLKDAGADQTDFEANYKNYANKKSDAPLRTFALHEGDTMRARLVGIINQSVPKNTMTNIDWAIPNVAYFGTNKQTYMDGLNYYADKAVVGDKITLQIVDVNNIIGYGAGAVLDEFGKDWAVMPNSETTIRLYKAKLIAGLYMRLKYTSVGTVDDVYLVCNLFRHMDSAANA